MYPGLTAVHLFRRLYFACGPFDQRRDSIGLRNVNGMAARDLNDLRTGAFRHESLSCRRDHSVVGRDQIPARLVLPGRFSDGPAQRFHAPRHLRSSHERGFCRFDIGRERRAKLRLVQKQKTILRWQDRWNRGSRRWVLDQRGNGFAPVGRKGRDIDKPCNLWIGAGLSYDRSAVRCAACGCTSERRLPRIAR
jgi:hypothetical protein